MQKDTRVVVYNGVGSYLKCINLFFSFFNLPAADQKVFSIKCFNTKM